MENSVLSWVLSSLCVLGILGILWWRIAPIVLFRRRAIETRGKITNWMSAKVKGVTVYKPIIAFNTEKGMRFTFVSEDRCEGKPMYAIGTEVTVLYDPKDPKNNKIEYPEI